MKTSARGIEDLVLSEGLRTKAYRDSVGVWTIGVGHAATSGVAPIPKAGMTITRQQALDLLATDLARYEVAVNAVLPNVPQHVFDGAVSFHFNTGAIRKASWVGKYRAGDMVAARKSFMDWRKPPEIIGRRTREAQLIFEGKYHSKGAGGIATYQSQLAALGYEVAVDGVRGLQTIAALKLFQRDHGLTADGIVGPVTRAALTRAMVASKQPVQPPPDDPGPVAHPDPETPSDSFWAPKPPAVGFWSALWASIFGKG